MLATRLRGTLGGKPHVRAVSALHWLVSRTKSTILSCVSGCKTVVDARVLVDRRRSESVGRPQRNRTYDHSRAVAGHVHALSPGGCVDAEHHQQRGQTEHAQDEPPGPADPQS